MIERRQSISHIKLNKWQSESSACVRLERVIPVMLCSLTVWCKQSKPPPLVKNGFVNMQVYLLIKEEIGVTAGADVLMAR